MALNNLILLLVGLSVLAYFWGRGRSLSLARPMGGIRVLHSLPFYYGFQTTLWTALPALVLLGFWLLFDDVVIKAMTLGAIPAEYLPQTAGDENLLLNKLQNIAAGSLSGDAVAPWQQAAADHLAGLRKTASVMVTVLVLVLALCGAAWNWSRIEPSKRARPEVERIVNWLLWSCAFVAVLTTVGIVLSVLFESIRFFSQVSPFDFLFGTEWSPQTAIRADQVGSSGSFGAIPLFTGTLLISAIAMFVAVPVGLMSAIYLAEYANRRARDIIKPTLEVLAGVPTVVYGFFAALTVAPWLRDMGASIGLSVSSESALAAGGVMGVMIIPFISSLADDVITAVPQSMRDGSLAMGATHSETVRRVVIPAALPGIVGGVLLAVSRAIGETMIVVMAAGLAAHLTANPLDSVTTITVQIVTLLTGDQEFDSAKTLAAFALGLMLFVSTLLLNIVALHIVKKYREQYE